MSSFSLEMELFSLFSPTSTKRGALSGTGVTWVAGETGKEGNLNPKRRQLDECTYKSETYKYVGGNNIYNIYFSRGGKPEVLIKFKLRCMTEQRTIWSMKLYGVGGESIIQRRKKKSKC